MTEKDILHETENLALVKVKDHLEIHLQGNVHAVLVGKPETKEKGIKFIERAEKNIKHLRKFLNHY